MFQIPICFNPRVQTLKQHVLDDLELTQCYDPDETPMYAALTGTGVDRNTNTNNTNNTNKLKLLEQFAKHYTTDTSFLKETQQLIAALSPAYVNATKTQTQMSVTNAATATETNAATNTKTNTFQEQWLDFKAETHFKEKYGYLDLFNFAWVEQVNQNHNAMQLLSIANIVSPILVLGMPILMLILPLVLLQFGSRGSSGNSSGITFAQYFTVLKHVMANHPAFKLFAHFAGSSSNQRMYLIVSFLFFLFSMYQNCMLCIRFFKNMHRMQTFLKALDEHLQYTYDIGHMLYNEVKRLPGHTAFAQQLDQHLQNLNCILDSLPTKTITSMHESSGNMWMSMWQMANNMGAHMAEFYRLKHDPDIHNTLMYSFEMIEYVNILSQLHEAKLTPATFLSKNKGKPKFVNMVYPKWWCNNRDTVHRGNDCDLRRNLIVTGPNASGKTTLLKTAMLNLILAQQLGMGCFDSLTFEPFDCFDSYLNIPDTSGRDSLFQAEARRCKEMIESFEKDPDNDNQEETRRHFCIFDELFSGTNVEEAMASSQALILYITKMPHVTFMLTTHLTKMCKRLSKTNKEQTKTLVNCHMNASTFQLEPGISKERGAFKVLRELNFPADVTDGR